MKVEQRKKGKKNERKGGMIEIEDRKKDEKKERVIIMITVILIKLRY